jgi:predicted aspartyl protease
MVHHGRSRWMYNGNWGVRHLGEIVMSMFRVNVVAVHSKYDDKTTPPIEALVDTGSELTWLPADALERIGITPNRKRVFQTVTKQLIERPVGYAILRVDEFETIDEVVFAEPGDMTLLGVRTLEGFGVTVDNIGHRFVATTTIVAVALLGPFSNCFGPFRLGGAPCAASVPRLARF